MFDEIDSTLILDLFDYFVCSIPYVEEAEGKARPKY